MTTTESRVCPVCGKTRKRALRVGGKCLKCYERDRPEYGLLENARWRAKQKGVPFKLTVADIKVPTVCPVFGMPLVKNIGGASHTDWSPTLDRIVPKLGYVPGNIIVVSSLANRIKSNATPEQIAAVAEFYRRLMRDMN